MPSKEELESEQNFKTYQKEVGIYTQQEGEFLI
jgi:hypothetical protein